MRGVAGILKVEVIDFNLLVRVAGRFSATFLERERIRLKIQEWDVIVAITTAVDNTVRGKQLPFDTIVHGFCDVQKTPKLL
jgi:hypothetical protein